MWFIILLVVLLTVYLFTQAHRRTTRQLTTTPQKYRIWTPSTLDSVEGRYYMAGYGVTLASASKIIKEAIAANPNKTFTTQQMQVATATIAIGTIIFYFRARGDERPFDAVTYLKPIGNIEDVTVTDVFTLTELSDQTLFQLPVIDNDQISVCDKCQTGSLGFGGVVKGSPLKLEKVNGEGVYITSGTQKLVTGDFLCPSKTLATACSTIGVGGPRVPVMVAGAGDVYYLESI